jgi:hypothetical protein
MIIALRHALPSHSTSAHSAHFRWLAPPLHARLAVDPSRPIRISVVKSSSSGCPQDARSRRTLQEKEEIKILSSSPAAHRSTPTPAPTMKEELTTAKEVTHSDWTHHQSLTNTSARSHAPYPTSSQRAIHGDVNHTDPSGAFSTPSPPLPHVWGISPISELKPPPMDQQTTSQATTTMPYYFAAPTQANQPRSLLPSRASSTSSRSTNMENLPQRTHIHRPIITMRPSEAVGASPAITAKVRHNLESKYDSPSPASEQRDSSNSQSNHQFNGYDANHGWNAGTSAHIPSEPDQGGYRNSAPRSSSISTPVPPSVAATAAFASAINTNQASVNSILSMHSDLPVDVASRLVAREGPRPTVEALLRLNGVHMESAQSSDQSYEEAEQLALLAVMDQCNLPLQTFEVTHLSCAYFSSDQFDDSSFPLPPTRPLTWSHAQKEIRTFAPDACSNHEFFGDILPPVKENQARRLDVAALATNKIFAREHRTQPVPTLSVYRARSIANQAKACSGGR